MGGWALAKFCLVIRNPMKLGGEHLLKHECFLGILLYLLIRICLPICLLVNFSSHTFSYLNMNDTLLFKQPSFLGSLCSVLPRVPYLIMKIIVMSLITFHAAHLGVC